MNLLNEVVFVDKKSPSILGTPESQGITVLALLVIQAN